MILLRSPAVERRLLVLALFAGASTASAEEIDAYCAKQEDPEWWMARRAAEAPCRDVAPEARRACQRERAKQLPPRRIDCARRRSAPERVTCEAYNRAVETCRSERGDAGRACIERHHRRPMAMVRAALNPLDCQAPEGEFVHPCALRRDLVAACQEELEASPRDTCLREYGRYAVLDCASMLPAQRGRCTAYNYGLKACRGRHSAELKACHALFTGMPDGEHRCGVYDRPYREVRYCAQLDRAYAKCAARSEPVQQFQSCVQASLPASYWIEKRLFDSAPIVK